MNFFGLQFPLDFATFSSSIYLFAPQWRFLAAVAVVTAAVFLAMIRHSNKYKEITLLWSTIAIFITYNDDDHDMSASVCNHSVFRIFDTNVASGAACTPLMFDSDKTANDIFYRLQYSLSWPWSAHKAHTRALLLLATTWHGTSFIHLANALGSDRTQPKLLFFILSTASYYCVLVPSTCTLHIRISPAAPLHIIFYSCTRWLSRVSPGVSTWFLKQQQRARVTIKTRLKNGRNIKWDFSLFLHLLFRF